MAFRPDLGAAAARHWVIEPRRPAVPVVGCLPHGGRDLPVELTADLAVSPDILWCDWLTRELYAFLPDLGITTVTTSFSRFVADVNRDPDGERHGGFWTSVVAARMPNGRAIYLRPVSEAEIASRISLAHAPFHQALDHVVGRLLSQFPRVLLLDLHSFGVPLDADVILGDRDGGTATPAATQLVRDSLAGSGLTVRLNERFTGGWTVRRFAGHDRVDAIQVELNQRRYLDIDHRVYPAPPRPGDFEVTQHLLRRALSAVTSPVAAMFTAT